jgi:hypothetical protein
MSFYIPDLEDYQQQQEEPYRNTQVLSRLHVYESPANTSTYCGLDGDHKFPPSDKFVSSHDLWGPRPLLPMSEYICPECAATKRYQEEHAWWTLGELP